MNNWISDGIRNRHWTCNVLLVVLFVPLMMFDIFVCFGALLDGSSFNFNMFLCFLAGIMAMIGAYHLVLKNSLGGLCLGVSAVLTFAEWFSYSDVVKYDMFDATELSTWEMFVKSIPDALFYSSLVLVPILLVLMIPKNWVPALFRLECKGVFIKLRYELLIELAFGIFFVYTQSRISRC